MEVGDVDSHGLFSHSRLVCVPGGLDTREKLCNAPLRGVINTSSPGEGSYLVVIGEGDDGSTDSQDHGRVDLTVRISGAVGHALLLEVIRGHSEHHCLLL